MPTAAAVVQTTELKNEGVCLCTDRTYSDVIVQTDRTAVLVNHWGAAVAATHLLRSQVGTLITCQVPLNPGQT